MKYLGVLGVGVVVTAASSAHAAGEAEATEWVPAIRMTASVLEATVTDISYAYDDVSGPRTLTTLSNVVTHRGEKRASRVVLNTFGGYLPDGRGIWEQHSPRYAAGGRVLIFLRNDRWFYSPAIEGWTFRVAERGSSRVVTLDDGVGVAGLGTYLPITTVPVFEPESMARPQGGEVLHPLLRSALNNVTMDVDALVRDVDRETTRLSGAPGRHAWGRFADQPTPPPSGRWNIVETLADEGARACFEPGTKPGDPVTCGGEP